MPLPYMTRDELHSVLAQLEQALDNHLHWHNSIVRTLVCGLQPNDHDIKSNADHECLFGQWLLNDLSTTLRTYDGFSALRDAHKIMHQHATKLLLSSKVGRAIDSHDYDIFVNAMERLRLQIASLRHEVEVSLYTHDPLTGAINRADMFSFLRDLHEIVQRQGQPCSIVMMDMDHFKDVNDKFGHPAGDKMLVAISHYIANNLRPYDKLFRFGGEEFLISMQQTELEECYERIEALRKGVSSLPICLGKRDPEYITASFGIAALTPEYSVEECIDHADKAMYRAKSEGRNCTRIFESLKNS